MVGLKHTLDLITLNSLLAFIEMYALMEEDRFNVKIDFLVDQCPRETHPLIRAISLQLLSQRLVATVLCWLPKLRQQKRN